MITILVLDFNACMKIHQYTSLNNRPARTSRPVNTFMHKQIFIC